MSLRWKIALALVALALASTIAIGTVSYRSTSERLMTEVDRSLVDARSLVVQARLGRDRLPDRGPLSGLDARVIGTDGGVRESTFPSEFAVTDADLAIVGRERASAFSTVATDVGDYRILTVGIPGGAVQIGRPLAETERVLDGLRTRILVWSLVIALSAAVIGWWIASQVTASLRRLTSTAEHVGATGRLDVEVETRGGDEVGRLGVAFDGMLTALARSKDDQRRLVQDAGHELRTPLTSLRTNLEALQRYPGMSAADRDAILADLDVEAIELTELVNEIIAVASGESSDEPFVEASLDELVADVVERYERRTGRVFELDTDPTPATLQRSAVQRAVSCLLDNARKFDPSGAPITVTVRSDAVTVADRGPGIALDDLDHVFDRFYRSDDARSLSGSGLGLSIVDEVARRHGGVAFARARDGGGAEVGFTVGRSEAAVSYPPLTDV
jgi:two-component system sensor histidine kinase MprB